MLGEKGFMPFWEVSSMHNDTSDRISACLKLYGQQLEAKDIGQLQDIAKVIGIDDKDTMFLLLLMLQSHFKAVQGLNDGVLDAQEKMAGVFDKKFESGIDKLSRASKKILIGSGFVLGILIASLSSFGGYIGSQRFYESKSDSQVIDAVRICAKKGGSVLFSGNSSRLACYAPDGEGKYLE